jgi:hypothetical protein
MLERLPTEVRNHLPGGYEVSQGVWLVLPISGSNGIPEINSFLRSEDWYPPELAAVIWFGDDGTGNLIGWKPDEAHAVLWNPEDGPEPWREGGVSEIWKFILNGYADET